MGDEILKRDIRCFYMMNGQVIFAEVESEDEDTGNYLVKNAVMVMIGQNKQIAMSTAFPFTNIDEPYEINWRHVTVQTDLNWNNQLIDQFDAFWTQLRAKAAGIITPAGAGPVDLSQFRK